MDVNSILYYSKKIIHTFWCIELLSNFSLCIKQTAMYTSHSQYSLMYRYLITLAENLPESLPTILKYSRTCLYQVIISNIWLTKTQYNMITLFDFYQWNLQTLITYIWQSFGIKYLTLHKKCQEIWLDQHHKKKQHSLLLKHLHSVIQENLPRLYCKLSQVSVMTS